MNPTPRNIDLLVEALNDIYGGAGLHPEIPLKQNTPDVVLATKVALDGTPAGPGGVPPKGPGLKDLWGAAKDARRAASAAYQSALVKGRHLTMTAIDVFRPKFGRQWNSQWLILAFVKSSLEVEDNPVSQLRRFETYLGAHPDLEVVDLEDEPVTSAACKAAADLIEATQITYNNSKNAVNAAYYNLQVGVNAGRNRVIGSRTELEQLLPPDDPRWLAFGFEKPAHIETPDVPANLLAVPADPGAVRAQCDESDRADSYRFVFRNPALPPEENVLVDELNWENQFTATELPSGLTITVEVSARNITGESAFSAPVTVVVP